MPPKIEEVPPAMTTVSSAMTPVSSVSQLNLKSTNLPAAWKHWLSLFKIYLRASSLEEQTDSRKVALLLHYMGPDSLDIFNSFNEDLDKITYDALVKKLDAYFLPKVNIVMERYSFFSRRQGPDESIDEFVTSLKNLSLTCDFGSIREDLVRDIFICGLHNKFSHLKEKLLNEEKISLEKAVLISRSMELNKEHVQQLQAQQTSSFIGALHRQNNNSSSETHRHPHHRQFSKPARQPYKTNTSSSSSPQSHIKSSSNRQNYSRYSRHSQQQTVPKNYHQQSSQYTSSNGKNLCKNCGQVHKYTCPAIGVTCYRCRGKDHFSKMCPRNIQVRNIEFMPDVSDTESVLSSLFIGVLQQQNENQQRHHNSHHQIQNQPRYQHDEDEPQWHVSLQINNCNISCQLDTGAQGNVMSANQLQTLGLSSNYIKSSNQNLITFSGEKIYSLGYCMLDCTYKNIVYKIKFIIVEIDCKCLIGLKTCLEMKLIKKNDEFNLNVNAMCSKNENDIHNLPNFIKDFKDVFEGLGCLKEKCHFKVKCDVTPVVDCPRKIPFALKSDFKKELERLERLNVIKEVKEPTPWVNSIVLVKKPNGNLRLCLDPRNLNKAILRPHFQFPNVEDFKAHLSGSKYFSVLDANSGFWMIQLDEESSMLCTFHTPFGRRRFLRLPFGINAAPEIFHCEMVKQFSDIPNLEIYIDDFLIHATTKEQHDKILKLVLLRARDIGLKFNPTKSKFCQTEVTFIGHLFSHDGVRPDPSKVEAICAIPRPKSKTELQRFLGMVNYLGTFVKGMSTQNVNLRNLLKKDVEWHWSDDHEKEFQKLKELISNTPVLTYFDVNKPLTLSVDASQSAVGAVISHDGNPIAYASATLTSSQQNYAQIEKELFAILFGCTKFHAFVFGKTVLVETDHKPLVPLFEKALYKVPARLQRFMLRLLAYDLKVIFKPGKYMYVADTLSRAAMPNATLTEFDKDISLHCNLVLSSRPLSMSKSKYEEIQKETKEDNVMSKVIEFHLAGWPNNKSKINELLMPYYNIRNEFEVIDSLLYKANRLVIPLKMRHNILMLLHEGHMGIERCRNLAKQSIYWPNIDQDILNVIKNCDVCIRHRSKNQKEPIQFHNVVSIPWFKIGMDLFEFNKCMYLLVVDFFSKYIEIAQLNKSYSSNVVITHLKSIFARHGIPTIMLSDNGPPFNSEEFKNFSEKWGIDHVTSSPYFPRSNGLAERSVQTIKKMLKKCHETHSDPYVALLHYRTTRKGNINSPSELLMSRQLKTKLPVLNENLKPVNVDLDEHNRKIKLQQNKTRNYYDKNAKTLPTLTDGQNIFYKKTPISNWEPGIVLQKCQEPRSYIISSNDGSEYRRNREHLLEGSSIDAEKITSENSDQIQNEKIQQESLSVEGKSNEDVPHSSDSNSLTPTPDYVTRFGRTVAPPSRFAFD
ncbi:uncharacterized protein K02A2.6-like [Episyrphus balteatus]|uniref:uncharacterized protein K02A2.6-like n=1 Tax=Episyrphus balteatus TaxID=286459 RepID=UPI00248527B0|nr:uncharacterized protein K02A2.6-like [Episyrphus balteatus]